MARLFHNAGKQYYMMDNRHFNHDDIVARLMRGDEKAFRIIYDAYAPTMLRVAKAMPISSDVAEDVVQDIFQNMWNARERAASWVDIGQYLMKCTRNNVITQMRRLARRVMTELGWVEFMHIPDSSVVDELARKLDHAIKRLPPQQKIIFEMCKLRGISHDVVAAELGLSPRTVNNHMVAALKTIRS